MKDEIDYTGRVRAIKSAAAARYAGSHWEFNHSGRRYGDGYYDDPLWWRLDVWDERVSSHALFDLRRDFTEEAIEHKFEAMEIARNEALASL
jgi:hypothetical protein